MYLLLALIAALAFALSSITLNSHVMKWTTNPTP